MFSSQFYSVMCVCGIFSAVIFGPGMNKTWSSVNKTGGPICNAGEGVVGSPSIRNIQNLTEHGPGQTALADSALSRGSDEAISRGPFQPELVYAFITQVHST